MKYLLILSLFLISCYNKTEIPSEIDVNSKPVTGEIIVKHVVSIELPSVFTDVCRQKYNENDYPDPVIRASLYNTCVSDYLKQLTDIISGLTPGDLPQIPK